MPSARTVLAAVGRVVRLTGRGLRATPVVSTYAVVLLLTTVLLRWAPDDVDETLLHGASTDVEHLAHDPLFVLVTSALLLPGMRWLPEGVVLLTVGRGLERRAGSLRTVLVLASGHLLGTALTELPIAAAIGLHGLPSSAASRSDVGASYALMALVTAYAGLLPRLVRLPLVLAAGVLVAGVPQVPPDMTTWGHLVAAATGVLWWGHLRHRDRARPPTTGPRVGARRWSRDPSTPPAGPVGAAPRRR